MKLRSRGARRNSSEDKMVKAIDQLAEFEEFKRTILPALQRDLKSGMSSAELRKKYAALAQARIISEALTNPDAGKAVVAATDLLNRAEGKATERKEIKHTLENASDKELDAVLASEIQELDEMNKRFQ